jgi:hypothetical protein
MIRKKDLGRLERIGEGAVGTVDRVPTFTLPGGVPLAYKEVRADLAPAQRQVALDAMRRSVDFRAALPPADQDDLDAYTCWPLAMVEDRGAPCGLVMPLIPQDFFVTTNPPGRPPETLVFDLSWLSAKDSQARNKGIDRSGVQDVLVRIALLAQLVYAVGRLHKHGAVYGDLSLKNAALAVGPPRVRLLDCDAAAGSADPTRVQFHSPFFMPPENASKAQKLQDDRTDVYKLGLCIVRGLQQGRGISQSRDPAPLAAVLDTAAVDAIARAVGDDRAARPSAKELFAALERNLRSKAAPPVLVSASLSRTALPRGTQVEVSWISSGGTEVRILGANGLSETLPDPGTPTGTHVITPRASGAVVVEIVNRHGSVQALAGPVSLYDLPPFSVDLTRLPRPHVPAMPPVPVPGVLERLPAVPVASTAGHPVPRIELPSLEPLADATRALRTTSSPIPRLDAAVADAARTVSSTLLPTDGPALAVAVADATARARTVLDHAWQDLRDRAARQRNATPRGPTAAPPTAARPAGAHRKGTP